MRCAGLLAALAAAALSLAACPAAPPQQVPPSEPSSYGPAARARRPSAEPEPTAPSADARVPDGEACYGAGECASGVCEGEGCGVDQPGKCVAASRSCSGSEQFYCSCAGQPFRAPSDCPAQRFSRRGACAASSLGPATPGGAVIAGRAGSLEARR